MKLILKCPCCCSTDLKHYGNTFECKDCENQHELIDMDFEELEE